jgi:5-formyltetrahydrofolate cyclo-ligase
VKETLRREYLLVRKGISSERKREANSKVFELLVEMTKDARQILSYVPLKDEVCVMAFNVYLAKQDRLSLPRIEGGSIVPYRVTSVENQLITFSHRFLEPALDCKKSDEIDLVVVPGVVFDNNGGRIGFGKGFYDRFLFTTKISSIGVAFQEQMFEGTLPLEAHDARVEKLCII